MLAAIAPGVALPPNSVLPRINGGRPRTNEYLFDGISVLQPEPGQVAYYPIVDAIQEFKIESNSPPAEFGRFNGGVVNLTTKSGGNAFHGNVFEFFRNEHLNARNYFQRANPMKPEYRRNQYGGMLGGPRREGPHVLLRGLSGTASAASAERSHRRCRRCCSAKGSSRKRSPGACRSSTIRRRLSARADRRFPATRFRGARWIPSRSRCSSATRCRPLPGPRTTTAGPPTRSTIRTGRRAPRSQVRVRPGSGVRTPDVLPRSRRAGHGVSGRQRRHSCRQRRHRTRRRRGRGRSPRTISTRSRPTC